MTLLFAPWLDRDDYDQEAAIARWQGKAVWSHLIDVTKGATRMKHRVASGAAELAERYGTDETVDAVLRREKLRETVAAVQSLAPRQRRCLIRSVNGMSLEEIAAAEDLSWKQAENAVSWARKTLRERAA